MSPLDPETTIFTERAPLLARSRRRPAHHRSSAGSSKNYTSFTMADVFLVGADWRERALVRAQLLEDGVDAEAYLTTREALRSLDRAAALPALLVADLAASADLSEEIKLLAEWADKIPVWVIASRMNREDPPLTGRGFERILYRPIDLGELAEEIKQRRGARRSDY